MGSTLHLTRRLAAGIAVAALMCQFSGASALALDSTMAISSQMEEVTLHSQTSDEQLLAHHGGEGATAAAGVVGSSVAPAMMLSGHASKQSYSDSLWGNMLLNMAYARDPELQKIGRRLGQVNAFTMMSVLGVSGLSLAQNIYAFQQKTEPQTVDVTPAHHPGDSDHVHIPAEKMDHTPATLGLISSGVTLGAMGLRTMLGKAYTTKLVNRQVLIREHVDSILARLEEGIGSEMVQPELVSLVGERASGEFLLLWKAVHPGNR